MALQQVQLPVNFNQYLVVIKAMILSLVIHLILLQQQVVALEEDPELRSQAIANFTRLQVNNAAVVEGAHNRGDPEHGPYDVIFIGGAVDEIPDSLQNQLNNGGRLAAVVVRDRVGKATLIERHGGVFSERQLFDAATPILPGFAVERGFVF